LSWNNWVYKKSYAMAVSLLPAPGLHYAVKVFGKWNRNRMIISVCGHGITQFYSAEAYCIDFLFDDRLIMIRPATQSGDSPNGLHASRARVAAAMVPSANQECRNA
jgi:hypothetical protein